jgi:RNA methyltransferase, TrmH family
MLSKNEIKNLRTLHQKKFRDLEQRFLIEGERIIRDLLTRHAAKIQRVFVTKQLDCSDFDFSHVEVVEVDELTIAQLAASKSPQGIVALVDYPEQRFVDNEFILVLDGVQDPGNLGTILRTAAWFGIGQVVCSTNSVDFCNPKVVQASMGAVFDVRITYLDLPEFLANQKQTIYGALLEGESIYSKKLRVPSILIMGNEGNGISQDVLPFITNPLSIPKYGVGESLNVGTATAIMLSTFVGEVL